MWPCDPEPKRRGVKDRTKQLHLGGVATLKHYACSPNVTMTELLHQVESFAFFFFFFFFFFF